MSHRYVLRFESGERKGETVPVTVAAAPGAAFTLGRKPGNSLQVVEGSVSGRHAELTIEGGELHVRDLESTNGTRVDGERVRASALRHGGELALGNVLFTVEDLEAPEGRGPGVRSGAGARADAAAPDERLVISADDLARSKRGSKLGLVVLAALAVAGGGAYWWVSRGTDAPGRAPGRPVAPPSGNLLAAGYSFEEPAGWSADESAPTVFNVSRAARASGERGLAAEFIVADEGGDAAEGGASPAEGGTGEASPDWALHRSDDARVRAGTQLTASAALRTSGMARARIGIVFSSSREAPPHPLHVWSDPRASEGDFETFELAAAVPPGYDRVHLVLHAESIGAGAVHFDDAALVAGGTAPAAERVLQWEVHVAGSPARGLTLAKVDQVLVADAGYERGSAIDRSSFEVTVEAGGLQLRAAPAGRFVLVAEPVLVASGIATLGKGGYVSHGGTFERAGATDLLLGADASLVRIVLPRESTVTGAAVGDSSRIGFPVAAGDVVRVQLRFDDERVSSQTVARRARLARSEGRPGDALRAWDELLASYPFEQRAIDEAATARSEIVRDGLAELRELGRELDRARFFRLVELYEQLAASAADVARRYAGSEVEAAARELGATIAAERGALAADLDRYERQRLESIALFLESSGAEGLAKEVRAYLAEHFVMTLDGERR